MHHYINMFQLNMEQNECSAGRKQPVMVLCNLCSLCRELGNEKLQCAATDCSGLIVSVSDRQ